jgi:rubrerythrin
MSDTSNKSIDDDDESVAISTNSTDDQKEMITSIFDDDMIEKYTDKEGKPKWRCKWCVFFWVGKQQRQFAI